MNDAHEAVDAAMQEIEKLRRLLKKTKTVQVSAASERSIIKAVCLTWFKNHRPVVGSMVDDDDLTGVDTTFTALLQASDRRTSRSKYDAKLKTLKADLSDVRARTVVASPSTATKTPDTPPSFAPLVADTEMQAILSRRWDECAKCIAAEAPLAATVMMGGLLESLLLARVLKAQDKSAVFGTRAAPRDKKTGKTLPLNKWTLQHYIEVAHELTWITASAKDIGVVLRDYRNYIHPQKELSHGVVLGDGDAKLFWEVAKSITRQLLA